MTSTLLTLIVLPQINLGIESLADWAKSVWAGSAPSRWPHSFSQHHSVL